jgi:outer membrane receptor for Fe3+-dicitrate
LKSLEYKNNSISEYGNFENRVSFDTKESGILRVNYKVAELKIEIPKGIDQSQISIRLFSDIRNSQDEDLGENELRSIIYPNPSDGNFNIELEAENEIQGVQVFNSYNRRVESFIFNNGDSKQFLNLGHLPSGVYYLNIMTAGVIGKEELLLNN